MIIAALQESSDTFFVEISGHSGNKGNSIVCAGVSALVESWRLSETLLENIDVSFDNGFVQASVPKTETSRVLFFQLSVGIKALAQQYPNEIKINSGGR